MKKLEWDSHFFKRAIYQINLDTEQLPINLEIAEVLYVISSQEHKILLPGFVETFAENKVEFIKKLNTENQSIYKTDSICSFFDLNLSQEFLNQLYQLAFISGNHSRFLLDKNFGRNSFEELYKKWIDNSISKEFADEVFIHMDDSKINGLITVSIKDHIGKIGLIAVDDHSQGRGIGTGLLKVIENYLMTKNVETLIIPTQLSNSKACNFYKKSGYEIISNLYIKHFWRYDTI